MTTTTTTRTNMAVNERYFGHATDYFLDNLKFADKNLRIRGRWITHHSERFASTLLAASAEGIEWARKKEKRLTSECLKRTATHKRKLEEAFRDEARYFDLIIELKQILREHYLLKYLGCRRKDLTATFQKYGAVEKVSEFFRCEHLRKGMTWGEMIQAIDEEERQLWTWQTSHSLLDIRRYGETVLGPKPAAPITEVAKGIADLCGELDGFDGATAFESLVSIVRENTGKSDRDFNGYTALHWTASWGELAKRVRNDRALLDRRFAGNHNEALRDLLETKIDEMNCRLFKKNLVSIRIGINLVEPTREACEEAIFYKAGIERLGQNWQ
ncbi:hypothetical protein CGLO_14072 [Colletotrichum gloeosporioides Cg-14]|uniref:Uncharacterized protein n=1 Tax=Colletotrichum gloeosporioides (strain Cg-14) TaxID=1237896 RepID=T0K4K1_COLGC|nr:hypothetical protein CGLO_14072 [Colletotrichum gloeosporioides Cg-14]